MNLTPAAKKHSTRNIYGLPDGLSELSLLQPGIKDIFYRKFVVISGLITRPQVVLSYLKTARFGTSAERGFIGNSSMLFGIAQS
ncbi:hypothetical protein [Erwinia sp. SLM-02]|uniref:hypothetical protein n=1 Tax=Erwinia sp. SLM-02 TaxID=3020057 RepID=UPI0030802F78